MLAVIPARGGSVGVPRKNLRVLGGKSLLARCIETCQKARLPVVVTTDDREIAEEAERYGATAHLRPPALGADDVVSWDVLKDAAPADGVVVWAQCTAPLMTAGDVRRCLTALDSADLAVAVHQSNTLDLDADGAPLFTIPAQRRQDMPVRYAVSGSCWAFRREYLFSRECYEGRVAPVLSENPSRIDIDTEADMELAIAYFSRRNWNAAR